MCVFQLTEYILRRKLYPGTIVDRLVTQGISPIEAATTKIRQRTDTSQDGAINTLRDLMLHEQFIKPWSSQHIFNHAINKCLLNGYLVLLYAFYMYAFTCVSILSDFMSGIMYLFYFIIIGGFNKDYYYYYYTLSY